MIEPMCLWSQVSHVLCVAVVGVRLYVGIVFRIAVEDLSGYFSSTWRALTSFMLGRISQGKLLLLSVPV